MVRRLLAAPIACSLILCAQADVQNLIQGTQFSDIQPAISAADEGDILLVEEGTYTAFAISGKSIYLFAEEGANVEVTGSSIIDGLAAHQSASLVGIRIPLSPAIGSFTALRISNNAGAVRIQGGRYVGADGEDTLDYTPPAGGHGIRITDSAQVVLSGVTARGGMGGDGEVFTGWGANGGSGVASWDSGVSIHDSTLRGGEGGAGGNHGGYGGEGYYASGLGLFAMASTFRGGPGGDAIDFIGCQGGTGGAGLYVQGANTAARLIGNEYFGGLAGDGNCCCQDGVAGPDKVWSEGPLEEVPGEPRTIEAPRVLMDGVPLSASVLAVEGDSVWLPQGALNFHFTPRGVWLIRNPAMMPFTPAGSVGTGGSTQVSIDLPPLPASEAARVFHLQGFFRDAQGNWALGTGFQTLVING